MKNIIEFVLKNLKRRKLRNIITILGITIGVIAIVSLTSLSEGLKDNINKEFENLGVNKITITSKYNSFMGVSGNSGLNNEDAKVIERIPEIKFVSTNINGYIESIYNKNTLMINVISYNIEHFKDMFKQNNLELLKGRYLENKKSKEIIVGYNFYDEDKSDDLFNKKVDIGTKIKINNENYKVVGIVKKTDNLQKDNTCYMSLNNLKKITNSKDNEVDSIYAIIKDNKNISSVEKKIKKKLENHRGSDDFIVTTPLQTNSNKEKVLGIVSIVIIGIASISLLVGGIGILNSMYTSVVERKKEIGVMMAIGAKRHDILMIFLLEAGIIGLIGGTIGIIIGYLISYFISFVSIYLGLNIVISLNINIILISLIFSFIIGLISGILPAYNASKQEPVNALREE